MLSTVLLSQRSYPAMLLAEQPVHQRLNISGPLVQGNGFLNSSRAPQVESKLSHDVLNSTQVAAFENRCQNINKNGLVFRTVGLS